MTMNMNTIKTLDRNYRIKPEGWVNTLLFKKGSYLCGKAKNGIAISIDGEHGGVLDLADAKELVAWLTETIGENEYS